MNKQNEKKLFAFKVAEKKTEVEKKPAQWQVRQSVATAGCSFPSERARTLRGGDSGIYC